MNLLGFLRRRSKVPARRGFHADVSRFPDALTEGALPLLLAVPREERGVPEPIDDPPPVRVLRAHTSEPVVEDVKVGPPPELYLLRITPARLVTTVRVTIGQDGKWTEHTPIFAESMDLAREMVPQGATLRTDCPREYADECWEVRLS